MTDTNPLYESFTTDFESLYSAAPTSKERVFSGPAVPNARGVVQPITYKTSALSQQQTRNGYATAVTSVLVGGALLIATTRAGRNSRSEGDSSTNTIKATALSQA
jgi:hypothetical protein